MPNSPPLKKEQILSLAELADVSIPSENLESVAAHFNNAARMYEEICSLSLEEAESEPAPVFQLPNTEELP